MGRDSTVSERLAARLTPKQSSESRIGRYRVELSLYSGGKERQQRFLLSIEVPTLKAGLGICRVASAYISNIALRAQSNGDSNDRTRQPDLRRE